MHTPKTKGDTKAKGAKGESKDDNANVLTLGPKETTKTRNTDTVILGTEKSTPSVAPVIEEPAGTLAYVPEGSRDAMSAVDQEAVDHKIINEKFKNIHVANGTSDRRQEDYDRIFLGIDNDKSGNEAR